MREYGYDIAVVGAGPAGAIFCAMLAAKRHDLRILLIDGQTPARTKPCGGLLAHDAQKVLASFHLTLPNSVLADPQIFAVETLDLVTGLRRTYQRHYLNMNRYAFDLWLQSLIPPQVTHITGRVSDIIRTEDALRVFRSTFHAKSIVGADGAGSLVRRTFFAQMPTQYTAIQEWYPDLGQDLPHDSCIFDAATSDSCSWTIRKDGYFIYGGAFAKHGCADAFEKQRSRAEAVFGCSFGTPVKREACALHSPRRMRDLLCGMPGVFLAGEAAGFISASSFEGISYAITSGCMLAEAYAVGLDDTDILRRYTRLTRPLRCKLAAKMVKRAILCTPILRLLIMKSGIQSISVTPREGLLHEN